MHPIGHTTYCLNYIRYHANKPIKIPIKVTNEEDSPAMKRGGFISMVNRFVEVLVNENVPISERPLFWVGGGRLPPRIEVSSLLPYHIYRAVFR